MPIVVAHDLAKRYAAGEQSVSALDGVSFTVEPGEVVAITGPSGSGKSTLLGLLAGLDTPSSGRLEVMGHDLAAMRPDELARLRGRRFGFVFQSFRLLPSLSAEENVRVPLELAGDRAAQAKAVRWLERVGLAERRRHLPAHLSGGEQQRVALARALAVEPAILFADEPTGNLDSATGARMAELIVELARAHAATLFLVTHEAALADRAGRVIAMRDGRIVSDAARPA